MSLLLNNNVGYTIVGSPTINNGIATNYNASNYIPISIENVENINNFEFVTYVQLGELNSWVYGISADSIGISNARWMLGTSLNKIRLIAGNVGAWTVDFTSNSEFNVNDWIYIKVYCDYTTKTFTLYTSLDGITWINEGSAINENYTEGTSRIIFLGRDNYALNCFAAIDINKTYIKYNNITLFNGKQTQSISIQDIKFNNNIGYTIIGTPTINNGIVSNFSNGNYLKLQSNIPIITSFEENIRFKITQDCAGKSLLSYSTTYNSNNLEGNINISNNLDSINTSLFIKYDGTYDTYIISYDFSQHLNEYFTFKVFTDLSNVYLYLYDKDNNLVGTNIYNNLNLAGIIDSNKILIGNIYDESDYWPSEIDLNNTYVKINNITWFNGKQTASTEVNFIILNNDIIWYRDWNNKPADWSDIRKGCPAESIALYVAHPSDFSAYDNFGFSPGIVGDYNVFIDGVQYGTTYTSGSSCSITWSTSGITTGDDITTPSAMKAHKIWIEPATPGNNFYSFRSNRVASAGTEEQGLLWCHFNFNNNISLNKGFSSGESFTYFNKILQAVTAKNNIINISAGQYNLSSAFYNCEKLEYLPIINGNNGTFSSYAIFYNCQSLKKLEFKNLSFAGSTNICTNCYNLEEFIYGLDISPSPGAFKNCYKLKKTPAIAKNGSADTLNEFITNASSLEDTIFDFSGYNNVTILRCYGSSSHFMTGFKGLRVSSLAPFTYQYSPQINISYTGMDRAALVQLFNDLPTVSAGQIINITGCTGTSSLTADDRAIATNKGWTINPAS